MSTRAHVYNVPPTGNIDGINTLYTLPDAYTPGTLKVFKNGLLELDVYVTEVPPNQFSLDIAPTPTNDVLYCEYAYDIGYYVGETHRFNITPYGFIDGSNKRYTLPEEYSTGSLRIRLNGLTQANIDVTQFLPDEFELDEAPIEGDVLEVDYDTSNPLFHLTPANIILPGSTLVPY